jgi:hypothetical protein
MEVCEYKSWVSRAASIFRYSVGHFCLCKCHSGQAPIYSIFFVELHLVIEFTRRKSWVRSIFAV